jgi:quinol monooxygenase YgiN
MAIYQTGGYQVKASAVDKVRKAIGNFVPHVRESEPGTQMYLAWQQKDDPTRFLHFFIFADAAAQALHGQSEAVNRFESVYSPELVGGDVVFTDYEMALRDLSQRRLVPEGIDGAVAGHGPSGGEGDHRSRKRCRRLFRLGDQDTCRGQGSGRRMASVQERKDISRPLCLRWAPLCGDVRRRRTKVAGHRLLGNS